MSDLAGSLTQRVEIHRPAGGRLPDGRPDGQLRHVATVFASITDAAGHGDKKISPTSSRMAIKIKVRRAVGLTPGDVVLLGQATYRVGSVDAFPEREDTATALATRCRPSLEYGE